MDEAKPGFRLPTELERKLIARLLDAQFLGREQLAEQLANIVVQPWGDGGGSLRLKVDPAAPTARVKFRVPVEAEGRDSDGIAIHVLLHVVDGKAVDLEIYRADGKPLLDQLRPEGLELLAY